METSGPNLDRFFMTIKFQNGIIVAKKSRS